MAANERYQTSDTHTHCPRWRGQINGGGCLARVTLPILNTTRILWYFCSQMPRHTHTHTQTIPYTHTHTHALGTSVFLFISQFHHPRLFTLPNRLTVKHTQLTPSIAVCADHGCQDQHEQQRRHWARRHKRVVVVVHCEDELLAVFIGGERGRRNRNHTKPGVVDNDDDERMNECEFVA